MNTQAGKDLPLVSFVIPCFNSVKYLARSLDSIIKEREESYPNLEIIVVDGGSKDGTVDVIRKYERHLAAWISEPDQGPGDAFNKGIRLAKGEFVRYMSADDTIICGGTLRLVQYLGAHRNVDVAGGSAQCWLYQPDGSTKELEGRGFVGRVSKWTLRLWIARSNFFPEACLYRRELFETVGLWRGKYRFGCDLDYWFILLENRCIIEILDFPCIHRHLVPEAITTLHGDQAFQEVLAVIREHAGAGYAAIVKFKCTTWLRIRAAAEIPFKWFHLHPLRMLRHLRKLLAKEKAIAPR
jgi:glycosyltransferase involved in cell wall biosynthesis